MRTIDLVDSPTPLVPFPPPGAQVLPSDTHELGETIASLAAGLHAAT